jgi:hypothetical protein
MSLDYDPPLDRLLIEHARRSRAEFTAPGLDGMLSTAVDASPSHRRWAWPLLAAVLLLAIPLITVLLVRHDRTAERPAQPSPLPSPTSVPVGPVPWIDPVWSGEALWFTAQLTSVQYCKGVPTIHAEVTGDGAASMTIVASLYVNPDRAAMTQVQKDICKSSDGSGDVGVGSHVNLPEPWKGQSAFDGTAHRAHKVLDASRIPSIPGLPPAYHTFAYSGETDQNLVEHIWVADDRREAITLSLAPIDPPTGYNWLRDSKPSTIGLVNGHQTRLGNGQHSIYWLKGAYVYRVGEDSFSGDHYRFSVAQLLDLARSVP